MKYRFQPASLTCLPDSQQPRRRVRPGGLLGIAMLWVAAMLGAPANATQERPSVALVLSGGGALGYAHIGVIDMLERWRIPVDCVVGTSMGAMVGGAYAAGVRPARMREILGQTDVVALFDDRPPRTDMAQRSRRDDYRPLFDFTLGLNEDGLSLPSGASAGYKFELFIKRLVGLGATEAGLSFDDLASPFRAVATDLESGEMKVFDSGELARVMRASMSLPAIIAPTEIGDRVYIDGGLVRNLPVDVGRELCGDVVIAVNLGTKPLGREQLQSSLDVARQSILILTEQNVRQSLAQLGEADILIEPRLDGFTSADFGQFQPIIERGEAAAGERFDALSALSVSETAYAQWLAERRQRERPARRIARIEASPTERLGEPAVMLDIKTRPGDAFDQAQLDFDLARTFGRGDFSYIGYTLVPEGDDAALLQIEAQEKPWGPGALKIGLGAATDLDSPAQLVLAAGYRRPWLNDLGAEWRADLQIGYDTLLSTELIQPWQIRDGAFVALTAGYRRRPLEIYQADNRIGDFQVERAWAQFDFGVTGRLGELRFGPYAAHLAAEPGLGVVNAVVQADHSKRFGLLLRGVLDQLDSVNFPRSGVQLTGEILSAESDWGSEDDFVRGHATASAATSFGESTLYGRVEWGEGISGDRLAVYDWFQLGGPRRLSGLYLNQLTGARYNLASLSYYYRFSTLPAQLGRGLYLGGSLETGRIDDPLMEEPWDWTTSGSLFWAADTLLGPAYFGYGYSSLGQGTFYLTIGPQF
jgi:NTE family protein